jgi:hypothetical protein
MKLLMRLGKLYSYNIYYLTYEFYHKVTHFLHSLELNMELPTGPTGIASSTAEQVRLLQTS